MNKLLLSIIFLTTSHSALSSDFCRRRQPDIRSLLSQETSRIAFKNSGGFFNKGVCWWHNRMQRSSAYLVKFEPQSRKPSLKDVKNIVRSLMLMDRVVVIPGFNNFKEFTQTYQAEVQSTLNAWQKVDGILNFEWMRGISGRSSLSVMEMENRMKDVFRYFQTSPSPLWVMAQIKGITSHSFLILDMNRTPNGFDLDVIDSNKPLKTIRIEYYFGDKNLRPPGEKYTFVPYVGFQNDFRNISTALKNHCPEKNSHLEFRIEDGDVENYILQY